MIYIAVEGLAWNKYILKTATKILTYEANPLGNLIYRLKKGKCDAEVKNKSTEELLLEQKILNDVAILKSLK